MSEPRPLLKAENLVKKYGFFQPKTSVDGVSFTLNTGEIVALLGENGAGKSTTFEMIAGMTRPTSGKVSLIDEETGDWMDITAMPLYQRARYGIGYLPQKPSVFANLTTRQNMIGIMELMDQKILMARIAEEDASIKTREQFCFHLLEQFGLTHVADTRANCLSGGEKRKLEIARLFIGKPRLVLMDEPYAGVDKAAVNMCEELFLQVRESGVAFLIVDHSIDNMVNLADRMIYLSKGSIMYYGTTEEVLQQPGIEGTLLGQRNARRSTSGKVDSSPDSVPLAVPDSVPLVVPDSVPKAVRTPEAIGTNVKMDD